MRLSTVFELLLIFLLIAFAAYGRVIDHDDLNVQRAVRSSNGRAKQENLGITIMSLEQATDNVNKYCKCNENICNCCRNFSISLFGLKGPGCASLQYYDNDSLGVQLNFGNSILTSKVIRAQRPELICFVMPGGYSKFCGRVYLIEREDDQHFKACLGLELQASGQIEAELRVSCFRFGPEGIKLRPADQYPLIQSDSKPDDDDDDDDDDLFGLDDEDDDDDDDEDGESQLPSKNTAVLSSTTDQQAGDDEDEDDDDDDDDDILGFGTLIDFITGGDDSTKKKTTTAAPILPFTIPMITEAATAAPVTEKPHNSASSNKDNKKPTVSTHDTTTEHSEPLEHSEHSENSEPTNASTSKDKFDDTQSSTTEQLTTVPDFIHTTSEGSIVGEETVAELITEAPTLQADASNDLKYVVKPETMLKVKRITVGVPHKKFGETSNSANAIKSDLKKPLVRPTKPDPVKTHNHHGNKVNNQEENDDDILGISALDDDDDDDYENEENSVEHGDEDENETYEDQVPSKNNKKPGNLSHNNEDDDDDEDDDVDGDDEAVLDDDDDDDDDDEVEDAAISAFVSDEKDSDEKPDKVGNTKHNEKPSEANEDYNVDFTDLLSRKRQMRRGRQSKVMRL